MPLLVVGTVAYDTVTTEAGYRKESLGGSATYFAISSSFFTKVGIVAVVGNDFADDDKKLLDSYGINTAGLEITEGKTFRWQAIYDPKNLNNRKTIDTQLNVFEDFSPKLSSSQRKSDYLFLGNIHPTLQLKVLEQMDSRPKTVGLDTMDLWIDNNREELTRTIGLVDILFMDDREVKLFTQENNVFKAAKTILAMGPRVIVVKKGEHGVLLFNESDIFAVPAFPITDVIDPTGAGDCFAGGFMGHLANTEDHSVVGLRKSAIAGTVMGSLAVEKFSTQKFISISNEDINERFRSIVTMSTFDPLDDHETLSTLNPNGIYLAGDLN